MEKRLICRWGTTVLTGLSDVGGVGVKVFAGRTGTDGRLPFAGAWFTDLGDGETVK